MSLRKRRNINLPLIEIIVVSLILHVVGLLILGGITIFNQIQDKKPELEAPPMADAAPPPPVVKIPPSVNKPKSSPPKLITAERPMPMQDLDFDMPVVEQRVGMAGGFGSGMGGGIGTDLTMSTIDFIGMQDKAESVCFIVDYSISMKDKIKGSKVSREDLMREKLVSSLSGLSDQMMVSVIFFSGPAWIAGDKESQVRKQYETHGDPNWFNWRPIDYDKLDKPTWHRMTDAYRSEITNVVKKQKLTGGTVWQNPLRLAMALDPAPDVIFFLTDGATSEEDVEETIALVGDWKRKNRDLRIHTVALGEPRAAAGMRRIAGRTGGKFRLIETMEDAQAKEGRGDG